MIEITSIPKEIKVGESFSIDGKADSAQVGKTVNLVVDNKFKAAGTVVQPDGSWQIEFQFLESGTRRLEFSLDEESVDSVILVIPAKENRVDSTRLSITTPAEEIKTEKVFTLSGKAEGYDDGEELVLIADKTFELARPKVQGGTWQAPVLFHKPGKRLVEIKGSEQNIAKVELDVKPASVDVPILSRSVWTSQGTPSNVIDLLQAKRITIHHTQMRDISPSATQSEEAEQMREIRQGHIARDFSDIGYHFVIMPSGRVYVGRSERKRGAHDIINDGLGIAFHGSFISKEITDVQFNSAVALCTLLCKRHGINDVVTPVSTPTADFGLKNLPRICGHRDRVKTDCPGAAEGKTVRLAKIRQEVQKRL
ncbi:peptidoglycan recognition family protein [Coleofasciculus sp. FACHB-T130]|uniref:peptidoglycan recognition protein family protein n=1 Tax=Cyanophyceae TaxID=3028117 RepID=UPI00168935BB|nr:peptidoglycan recognition family protein [Coleofasciculus sp. FACHB-T130]MBD1879550.1 N-acetylmuramoyl-L-alanine amidase [Coleofasciculus sp. FACHB-T130]